jgi:hypothetical protein
LPPLLALVLMLVLVELVLVELMLAEMVLVHRGGGGAGRLSRSLGHKKKLWSFQRRP